MVVTLVIGLVLKATIGLRADPQHEADGLDDGQHAESAYDLHVRGGRLEPGR